MSGRYNGLQAKIAAKYDFGGKLSGSKANLEYEILNIERIIDGLLSIPSVFIIHEALVHVHWIHYSRKRNLQGTFVHRIFQ